MHCTRSKIWFRFIEFILCVLIQSQSTSYSSLFFVFVFVYLTFVFSLVSQIYIYLVFLLFLWRLYRTLLKRMEEQALHGMEHHKMEIIFSRLPIFRCERGVVYLVVVFSTLYAIFATKHALLSAHSIDSNGV